MRRMSGMKIMQIEFTLKRICTFILLIVLGLYLLICLTLYSVQERLLFFPRGVSEVMKKEHEETFIETVSGEVTLRGWLTSPESENLIIYYGGNGEELSHLVSDLSAYSGFSSLLVNYRGYGESEGKPSEQALFKDALHLYDTYAGKYKKVFLIGRSLGTGVASYVASQRAVTAVTLITPYDSISNTAQEKFPILPMRLLVRHPFDSVGRAGSIHTPAQFLIAERDRVISRERSKALFDAWAGEKTWVIKEGHGHNSYNLGPSGEGEVYAYFRKFTSLGNKEEN